MDVLGPARTEDPGIALQSVGAGGPLHRHRPVQRDQRYDGTRCRRSIACEADNRIAASVRASDIVVRLDGDDLPWLYRMSRTRPTSGKSPRKSPTVFRRPTHCNVRQFTSRQASALPGCPTMRRRWSSCCAMQVRRCTPPRIPGGNTSGSSLTPCRKRRWRACGWLQICARQSGRGNCRFTISLSSNCEPGR